MIVNASIASSPRGHSLSLSGDIRSRFATAQHVGMKHWCFIPAYCMLMSPLNYYAKKKPMFRKQFTEQGPSAARSGVRTLDTLIKSQVLYQLS